MTGSILRAIEPARDESPHGSTPHLVETLAGPPRATLASVERLGRRAEAEIDRLRGRPRRPALAWLVGAALMVGFAVVIGAMAMSRVRARGLASQPDALEALEGLDRMSKPGSLDGPDLGAAADLPPARGHSTGLTVAEDSLLSYDPVEGRDA